jgi:hypothetical protein
MAGRLGRVFSVAPALMPGTACASLATAAPWRAYQGADVRHCDNLVRANPPQVTLSQIVQAFRDQDIARLRGPLDDVPLRHPATGFPLLIGPWRECDHD